MVTYKSAYNLPKLDCTCKYKLDNNDKTMLIRITNASWARVWTIL